MAERIELVKCPKRDHVFNAWEHCIDGKTRGVFIQEWQRNEQGRIKEAVDAIQ